MTVQRDPTPGNGRYERPRPEKPLKLNGHPGKTPIQAVLDGLARAKCDHRPKGPGQWESTCPVHKGSRHNLSVKEGDDGTVVLHCHHDDTGKTCTAAAIVDAIGLKLADLFPAGSRLKSRPKTPKADRPAPPPAAKSKAEPKGSATHQSAAEWYAGKNKMKLGNHWLYDDAEGTPYAAVYRLDSPDGGKMYLPVRRNPQTLRWIMRDPPQWLPYRVRELLDAPRIYLFEGEKCADIARSLGLVTTTAAHGAKSPQRTDFSLTAGREIFIVPDHDSDGERFANTLGDLLAKLSPPPAVKILRLPGLVNEGDDIEQWIDARVGTPPEQIRAEIEQLAKEAPQWTPPEPPPPVAASESEEPADINLTDLGNARRLVREFGDVLRYSPKWGSWFCWDGRRWKEDETGEIYRRAKTTVRTIGREIMGARSDDGVKAILRWAMASESKRNIEAMVGLAWSEPGIPVEAAQLNRDHWALNVQNGTIDLKTGQLRPHRQTDLITKIAGVSYDPTMPCPKWLAFLDRIMAGNQNLVGFLQRAGGYALSGDVSEHCLFFLFGTGRNGKGTFLETILALLGDYATTIDASLITAKRHEDHPTGLTDLDGRRFVPTVEVEDGKRLAEALVKKLTGGDRIKARRMRQDNYEFDPTFKLFVAANHEPEIMGMDEGIWSRIKMIPFDVFIPAGERDKHLRENLIREEGPGILAWLVRGCLEWQRAGLQEPAEVITATEAYRASMDSLADFLNDKCESYLDHPTLKEQARTLKDSLYKAYSIWAKANGCDDPLTARKFATQLEKRGYKLKTSNGRYYRLGLTIKASEEAQNGD